jgi:acylpyruvate hydrolase
MKVATFCVRDAQAPGSGIGAVVPDGIIDLHYAYACYLQEIEHETRPYAVASGRIPRDMKGFLEGGQRSIDAAVRTVDFVLAEDDRYMRGVGGERLRYALEDVRLLAPLPNPGKIFAAGKNYADHAAEGTDGPVQVQPFPRGFIKVASTVIGPDQPVELPQVTQALDYEVELAVVIGKRGRHIPRDQAYDYVAGYTIVNDVSARDIQAEESKYGNHMIAKSLDTHCPMGPWIALLDEVPDPMDLDLRLKVNDEVRQDANTSTMIHDIPAMIERWSWATLEPGDVIATGTPAGVALSGKHPYLKEGDVMECVVEHIGVLRNPVVGTR